MADVHILLKRYIGRLILSPTNVEVRKCILTHDGIEIAFCLEIAFCFDDGHIPLRLTLVFRPLILYVHFQVRDTIILLAHLAIGSLLDSHEPEWRSRRGVQLQVHLRLSRCCLSTIHRGLKYEEDTMLVVYHVYDESNLCYYFRADTASKQRYGVGARHVAVVGANRPVF